MNFKIMRTQRFIIALLLGMLTFPVLAQLSDGGVPMDISYTKSTSGTELIILPTIDNQVLLKASLARFEGNRLKPFRFAEPIDVSLNIENSGHWFEVDDYRVWQLTIVSSGAKSLNIIFDKYNLPPDARLFLFSPDHDDILGAFTATNNKSSGKLATSPIRGDRITLQYEEPLLALFKGELSIAKVNHDFVGIKSLKDERRPLGISGSCNLNINCDLADAYRDESNAACRIIIGGVDLCTGSLVNNTAQDGTPYVYTAGHCISTNLKADESVFLFNYESPYCGEIDGDASHTISGSVLRATSDDLDFSLVELSINPPPSYRPYFLGWERTSAVPDSSICIHHPVGDVKKIAIDRHAPQMKSYSSDYVDDAFFFIGNWEEGTTEGGSSGAPLINPNKRLVGSLTGGAASCANPFKDYFARFSFAWDYYSETGKQLKPWLDPNGSNALSLDGFTPYTEADLCGAYTNFKDDDTHIDPWIIENDNLTGYWSGNNNYGYSEFAEKFENSESSELIGVSIGIAKSTVGDVNSFGKINFSVYSGDELPDELLYSQLFALSSLDEGVMNYLEFDEVVNTTGTFFITYSLELLEPADTFAVYIAKRDVDPINTFFIKDGAEWYSYPEKTLKGVGSALLMEVVMCNMDTLVADGGLKNAKLDFEVFPNPFHSGQNLLVKFKKAVSPSIVQVFNLMGKQVQVQYTQPSDKWLSFNFSGQTPGNYFIKIIDSKGRYRVRVIYLGTY